MEISGNFVYWYFYWYYIIGGVLSSQVYAVNYDSLYYLKRIYSSVSNLESYLSSIEDDVDDIEDYVYWIYGNM